MRKNTFAILRFFYREVWREKPIYFLFLSLDIFFMALFPFANIIFPKYIIDELLGGKRVKLLVIYAVALVVSNWICKSLMDVFSNITRKIDNWFEMFFDIKFTRRFMTMDYENTENPEILNQGDKAQDGMGWYSGGLYGLSTCIKQIISAFITICGVMFIIASASPYLFLIAIVAVGLSSVIVSRINKIEILNFNKGPEINRAFWYMNDIIGEECYGKDIRLYGADGMLTRKGKESFSRLYHLFKEVEDGKRFWGCINSIITMFFNAAIYLYLGYLAFAQKITIGSFTMLISSAGNFRTGLSTIITQLQELEKKANFMGEYKKFMEFKDCKIRGEKSVPDLEQPEIVFDHVYFKYPRSEEYVLEDINITIKPGEHLSVVGQNGAGKTTFIKLLCRMYDVTKGAIYIDGINIREYQYEEYMRLLSVVFQDFKLLSVSMKENIAMGDWKNKKEDKEILELCEMCGLKDKIENLPNGLDTLLYKYFDKTGIEPSGGEAQKMAISRAIYKDAPIIVLDEPTAALDPVAEYEIYRQFDLLVGKKTAVYISHRLSSCKFCDKIAVFDKKTITEYGTHDELMKQKGGQYATMFEAQAQYYV